MPARKLALVLASVYLSTATASAPSLYITTELPLAEAESAELVVATAWVRKVASRARVSYTMVQYPWNRAYALALERADGCVFATSRLPERENLFQWVGPATESEWVLVGLKGRDYGIRTLEDARRYRIGTYIGDARHNYLSKRGFRVDPAQLDRVNPQKLRLGRIDLWASATPHGREKNYPGYFPDDFVPVLTFQTVGLYLACNRKVPAAVIARMNAAVAVVNAEAAATPPRASAKGRPRP